MRQLLFSTFSLVCFVSLALATSADGSFALIKAAELESLLGAKNAKVAVFDANAPSTRKREGIIPGARLLDSYNKYDVTKFLPEAKDAKLVFYCANEKCLASHDAAKRASNAGYTNVAVMTEGIQGWKKSGRKTVLP